MDVGDEALQSALARLERLLDLGESVQGSDVTVPMPRLVPLTMAANGAVEMLAALGVCPADQLSAYRTRLERLGIERSEDRDERTVSGSGSFSSASATSSPTRRVSGGPTSVSEWQRGQVDEVRKRLQPPTDESPTVMPLSLLLSRSDTVAVILVQASVYTTGISWSMWTHGRGAHPPFFPTHAAFAERMGRRRATAPEFSVTFDDGRTSVAVDRVAPTGIGNHPPDSAVLLVDTGSGNEDLLRREHWLTPRPTGKVTIDFAWPEQGLGSRRHTIDLTGTVSPDVVWE